MDGRRSADTVEDISLHILDIAENALRANATRIEIVISSDTKNDLLTVEIGDNGRGMDPDTMAKVRDPFFTTKGKKTGLGVPLIAQAAEQAGGKLAIESTPGKGTRVTASFQLSHVDRPAVGDIAGTVMTLIAGHPDVDVVYEERRDGVVCRLDTAEIKQELEGMPINEPSVLDALRTLLKRDFILTNEGHAHE